MPLEVAQFINTLNPANPVGSDPLSAADDHIRMIKQALKNTFPNIDAAVTVTDNQLNELPSRLAALEAGGVGGGGGGTGTSGTPGIGFVSSLPTSGAYDGQLVYLSTDKTIYAWDTNTSTWTKLTFNFTLADVPPAVKLVSSLSSTAPDGEVVLNTTNNKLYERVNGAWVELTIAQNVANTVADASITIAKFAQGIRPVEIVSALPTSNNVEGRLVYLTTDDKIYRYNGAAFVTGMPFGDLIGTIGADQIAANSITGGKIQAGSISADQIAAGGISATNIAASAITTEKIAATAITAEKIATNAITTDKLAANVITAGKISAGAVGTTELAASAITSDKIAAGSIFSDKIAAGAIIASKISAGTITGDKIASNTLITANLQAGSSSNGITVAGPTSVTAQDGSTISNGVYVFQNSSTVYGLLCKNSYSGNAGGAAKFISAGGFTTDFSNSGAVGLASVGLRQSAIACSSTNGGAAQLGVVKASSGDAVYSLYSITGSVGPFTGAHDILLPKSTSVEIGDILVDVAVAKKKGVSDVITVGAVSSVPNQKGAVGVFIGRSDFNGQVATFSDMDVDGTLVVSSDVDLWKDTHDYAGMNSVGEGQINVCGENGNIEIGDLIVTSSIPGKGMKQSDDIVRSYSVAKARENVTFSSTTEVKQIACIYISG